MLITASPTCRFEIGGDSRFGVKQMENSLVHAKHDGSRRDGSKEVWGETAVQAHDALLAPDEPEALDKPCVLWTAVRHGSLAESRPGDLAGLAGDSGVKHDNSPHGGML